MATPLLLQALLLASCCGTAPLTGETAPQAAIDSPAVPAMLARFEYRRTEFSGSDDAWHSGSASVAMRFRRAAIEMTGRYVDRGEAEDVGVGVDAYIPTWTGAYANLRLQAAPGATVIPRFGSALELYQVIAPRWEASAGARHDRYPERVTVLGGSLAHFRGPWSARARVSAATVGDEWAPFWSGQLRRSLGDPDSFLAFHAGAGDEVVEILSLDSGRVQPDIRPAHMAGFTTQIMTGRHLGARVGVDYNKYEDIRDRVRGSIGLVVRW